MLGKVFQSDVLVMVSEKPKKGPSVEFCLPSVWKCSRSARSISRPKSEACLEM